MGSLEIAEAATEVLEPGELTLAELAETTNLEHRAVQESAKSMVDHAIAAGSLLLIAKKRCRADQWTTWVRDNLELSLETVAHYIRIAQYKALVWEEKRRVEAEGGALSIERARQFLQGLPTPNSYRGSNRRLPKEMREQALRLHEAGLNDVAIGGLLGVHKDTVRRWRDPRREVVADAARKRRVAARRALALQEREDAIKRAVRKAGAAEQELYAMAERMQDVMGQAHREATDREKRKHYALAGEHYRKMRDEIVRALGVS